MGTMHRSNDLSDRINRWLQENPNQLGRYWFTDSNQNCLEQVRYR